MDKIERRMLLELFDGHGSILRSLSIILEHHGYKEMADLLVAQSQLTDELAAQVDSEDMPAVLQ